MQERISHWLIPPIYGDTERQWYARITHILSLTLLGAFVCNRQGYVRVASFVVVFVLLFVTTLLLAV